MFTPTTTIRHAVGRCPTCGLTVGKENTPTGTRTTCPGCATVIVMTGIRAVYNGAMPCDDRCMYAVGPYCSCACGGENHCRGFIPPSVLTPEWTAAYNKAAVRDRKRHEEKQQRAAQRRQTKADRIRQDTEATIGEHPVLAFLVNDELTEITPEAQRNDFYFNVASSLLKYGNLTDRQVAAIERSVEREKRYDERRKQIAEEKADAIARGVTVPTGRITFTGEVATVKEHASDFRVVYKMVVKHPDGWALWTTVPREVESMFNRIGRVENDLRGKTVTVTATVKPSDRDQLFGFGSRPIVDLQKLIADNPQLQRH